ncbi:hypothetical protein BH23BAC4_BH23BAC4_17440 [soil metagenome]
MLLAALLLVPDAQAQSERFEEIKWTYESRDGAAASTSNAFAFDAFSPAALGRIMPGGITNRGRTPANVVIWLEAQDERRGFALFSPRQRMDAPSNAVPVAHANIKVGETVQFGDFAIVGEHGDMRRLGDATSGRLIIAAQTDGPLNLEATTRQLAEPEDEEVQMMPRWPSTATGKFTPSGAFFVSVESPWYSPTRDQ